MNDIDWDNLIDRRIADCHSIAHREADADALLLAVPSLTDQQAARVRAYVNRSSDFIDDDGGANPACAIDALCAEESGAKERVRLQKLARAGGYRKPWGRGAGY